MFPFRKERGLPRLRWRKRWRICAIVGGAVLFACLLLINVAGHGYERESFQSKKFNLTSQGFPGTFLRDSSRQDDCEAHRIQTGNVFRTNHTAFQYTVVGTGGQDLAYRDTPLQNCSITEILVRNHRSLDSVLPTDFGFAVNAEALISCESPDVQLTTEYTYSATDPLQKAKDGNFPTVDLGNAPSHYWSQALLVYWWDQLSVNLTQANNATFEGNLQTVLLQAVYNQSHSDIVAHSTFTTSVFESNSSRPTSFTSPNSTNFSPEEVALLGKLQIPNVLQFFTSFYWAVQLDLGQSDPQNIFLDKSLLSSATRVFHNNDFIGNVYQNTPLTDNTIPGDGFPNAQGSVAPLSQTDAFIAVEYQCSRQTGKSALLALIDVIVPSVVLFVLICVILYALGWCIWGNITDKDSEISLHRVSNGAPRRNSDSYPNLREPDDPLLTPRLPGIQVNRESFGIYQQPPSNTGYFPLQRGIQQEPYQEDTYVEDDRVPEDNRIPENDGTPADSFPGDSDTPAPQSRPSTVATTIGGNSSTSILPTPLNALQPPLPRINAPSQSESFQEYNERMEGGHLDPSNPNWRRLSQRKSNTDLRRRDAVK